jgi:hypothetical protein
MRRNELRYLQALKSFSVPARALWKVTWLDGDNFDFEFQGSPSMYRYFDATPCVSFVYEMALEALRKDLKEEVAYLSCYDEVVRRVNDRYDIQGSTLANLIRMAYQNGGMFSKNQRKQFADQVETAALDFIEAQVQELNPQLTQQAT